LIDSEEILLGGFMFNQGLDWQSKTRPEWFSNSTGVVICETIQRLHSENKTVDLSSVVFQSGLNAVTVSEIYNKYSGQELSYHWAIVRQEWTRRHGEKVLQELSYKIQTSDPFEILKELQGQIDLLQLTESGQGISLGNLLTERAANLATRKNNQLKTVGLPSGYARLDKFIGGFVPGELIVLAGRPGMGKTALAFCLAIQHCRYGGRVMFFSIEMNKEQLGDRGLALIGQIDNLRIRAAEVSDEEIERINRNIYSYNLPFEIETSATITIDQIRARVKCMNPRPTLVVIDYMQLIHGQGKKSREQEVSYISRQCKLIAKDCKCTVLALSQLNRETEDGNTEPKLKNLRESGAIEQDADTVMFPYRPAYYGNKEEIPEIEEDPKIIIAKCRNGMLGNVPVSFRSKTVEYFW